MNSAFEGSAETELHGAAWSGDIGKAKELISSGADVNVLDSINEAPLHGASAWAQNEMVKFLLSHGADPNIFSADGLTALHWACSHAQPETVDILVTGGAKIVPNKSGKTPLEIAKNHNNQKVIAWLNTHT